MEIESNSVESEFSFAVIRPENGEPTWSLNLKIVFVLQGSGVLHFEGNEKAYSIHQEDVFVINGFQMYSLVLNQDGLALVMSISPSFLTTISPETNHFQIQCKSFLYGEDKQQIFDILRRDFACAFRAQYKNESELTIHLRSKVAVLLDDLFSYFGEDQPERRSESGKEWLRTAVDYIHGHFKENMMLSDLAECTYLSTSYISRSFQKYVGCSFSAYLTQVRLLHAAAMLRGNQTITEIAYDSGFPNTNALIEAYKQKYGITPGQYRRQMQKEGKGTIYKHREGEVSTVFANLMKYAEITDSTADCKKTSICDLQVDLKHPGTKLSHNWKRIINVGYARSVLDGEIQRQIRMVQERIGFQYIRCKGILDDDMMFYIQKLQGDIKTNYVYIDRVIDFILSVKAKPMLEMGHMPSLLAKNKQRIFCRQAIISVPSDIMQWETLIEGFLQHLLERYGMEEMNSWLFAPWIAAEFENFGMFTKEEYWQVFERTYRVIKRVGSQFKIGAPGKEVSSPQSFIDFINRCKHKDCLPDILTAKSFSCIDPEEENCDLKIAETGEAFQVAVSKDEEYLANAYGNIREALEHDGNGEIPIMLEEWSNNIWQRDLCNDTAYKSTYIVKNILENYHSYYGMGYFSIGDELEEVVPSPELFHGGFGLFIRNGIPKSAFRALELLSYVGERLVKKGEGYFISMTEKEVQIYLYNYCHYDMLYRYRNVANLSKNQRYKVFNAKKPCSYHIQLEGIQQGKHTIKRYRVGPNGGSTFDAWIAMGAPEKMTKEEEEQLLRQSYPLYQTETIEMVDKMKIKAWLMPHEIQLIIISL